MLQYTKHMHTHIMDTNKHRMMIIRLYVYVVGPLNERVDVVETDSF